MNRIDVEVYPSGSDDILEFRDVNYISLVNDRTFGIPALISERAVKHEGLPVTILYVNPLNIVTMKATRTA